jgi:hypothetical protein
VHLTLVGLSHGPWGDHGRPLKKAAPPLVNEQHREAGFGAEAAGSVCLGI